MRSLILIYRPVKGILCLTLLVLTTTLQAQVNSPFSRFGIGDLYNGRNMANKAMGGVSAAYSDVQSVNFNNPASYTSLGLVTYDVGLETEVRTLSNPDKTDRFQSANMIFSYATMGMRLAKNKKEKTVWGLAFGIRPISRVRYNIQSVDRLPNIDSISTEYRGNGGIYRGFIGTGLRLGGLSLGVNVGYLFGQQDLNTFRSITNDTIFHYVANVNQKTSINKFYIDGGAQYEQKLGKKSLIRIGAHGNLGGEAKGERDLVSQTTFFNSFGEADTVDVVERSKTFGRYVLPASYTVGVLFDRFNKLSLSAEYEHTRWADFRNFGANDNLADIKMWRFGGQFIPDVNSGRNYFKQVAYRAGYFSGNDYVIAGGEALPVWGITVGAGLPVRRFNAYSTQYSTINLSIEYGRRGRQESLYNERYFRIGVGLSLSDVWFFKRQYD